MRRLCKLFIVLIVISMLATSVVACGSASPKETPADEAGAKSDVNGEIGKDYDTQWFSFRVDSAKKISKYSKKKPGKNKMLIDIVLHEKNTYDKDIPIGTFDFYLDAPTFKDYLYSLDPLDAKMMPKRRLLKPGEEVAYHLVYAVPKKTTELSLKYTEVDINKSENRVFVIPLAI